MIMAHTSKNYETFKDARLRQNRQYNIPEDKSVAQTGLDILYTSQVDRNITDENVEKKISLLKHLLEKDLKAADFKWSLFVAASNTYRYDTCLKPFPPMYIKNECKDIEALRRAIESVPPLSVIFKELNTAGVYENYREIIELLYWVLLRLRDPHIKSVQKEYYDWVLKKVPLEMPAAAPNLIFQVENIKQSTAEEKWKSSRNGHSTFYAYHGTRLENFHSIVHYGLQQNMCKRSEFGKGIYLSSELGVSLPYSPVGYGWGGSILGSEISCIALCELINHPDIKRGDSNNDAQNTLEDSMGGRIPDKYYVVTNSDLVKVRYLLVYAQDVQTTSSTDNSGLLSWFKQHKLLTFIAVNQENVKNLKPSVAILPTKTKRPVLREISNKVNTLRGVEPIDRTSLLQKDKKMVTVAAQKRQPVKREAKEKIPEKSPQNTREVQVVKPVVKTVVQSSESNVCDEDPTSMNISDKKVETPKAFSSDLIYEDIDEQDEKNPILVSLYTNEIHEYLRGLENKYPIERKFLTGQEVTPKMRSVLVDWLVDVHQQFRMMQETLYLTVAIIDRFLQAYRTIDRKRLQLVGVTAMFIASKYEEMYSPDISDFVYITDQAYTKSDILKMEMVIVKHLNFSFGRPLPLHFLRRYSKAGKALPIHHTMAKYFLEQSLIHYNMCHYPPSLIAAAAIYLAFIIIGNDEQDEGKIIWTNTLAHYSTYSKDDVLPAVRDIAVIITNAETSKYQAVRKKYVHSKYFEISVRPELKSPTLLAIAKANDNAFI
ncbi:G2/mitotic-specific cyclin-B-like [Odontomachus brunneus]|uniref:G2/mitotic-specific cyclin-B-like n=1 Tax=Odontomachus brunneus TaxID=486640 RepID=UPI0013F1F795|nr:G2/mitotic-specific cyclin-B-like [Odontomachus brunneus]